MKKKNGLCDGGQLKLSMKTGWGELTIGGISRGLTVPLVTQRRMTRAYRMESGKHVLGAHRM